MTGFALLNRLCKVVNGALRAASQYSLPGVSVVGAEELASVYPGTLARPNETVLLERGAGWLAADAARSALRRLAAQLGAEFRFQTRMERWSRRADGTVEVMVAGAKAPLKGRSLVLAAGPWTQRHAPGLSLHPRRAVLSWFEVLPEFVNEVRKRNNLADDATNDVCVQRRNGPGFMLERDGHVFIYGFPAILQADGKYLLKYKRKKGKKKKSSSIEL